MENRALTVADVAAGDLALQLDALRSALERAQNHDEVQAVRDRSKLIAEATKHIKALRDTHFDAVELQIWATRRIGDELLKINFNVGRSRMKRDVPRLRDLGFTDYDAKIARTISKTPDQALQDMIASGREARTLNMRAVYLQSRALLGPGKVGTKTDVQHVAEAQRIKQSHSRNPTATQHRNLLITVRTSLRRLLPRLDPAARRKFLAELRTVISDEEGRAAAGAPEGRFDDDPRAARPEPRLGSLPPATDPKC